MSRPLPVVSGVHRRSAKFGPATNSGIILEYTDSDTSRSHDVARVTVSAEAREIHPRAVFLVRDEELHRHFSARPQSPAPVSSHPGPAFFAPHR